MNKKMLTLFFLDGTTGDALFDSIFVNGFLYGLVNRKNYKEEATDNLNMYPVISGSLDAFSFLNLVGGFSNDF